MKSTRYEIIQIKKAFKLHSQVCFFPKALHSIYSYFTVIVIFQYTLFLKLEHYMIMSVRIFRK